MRMQDPPFPLPYEVPPIPKPFSDYEWDDSYPGTMKPGLRNENRQLDDVLQDWEDKENGNVMELPRDQLWQVPARGHPKTLTLTLTSSLTLTLTLTPPRTPRRRGGPAPGQP